MESVLELTEYIRDNVDKIVKQTVELDLADELAEAQGDLNKIADLHDRVRRALTTFADDELLQRVVARGAEEGKISADLMKRVGTFFGRDFEWRILNRRGWRPSGFSDLLSKTKSYLTKHAPEYADDVDGKMRFVGLWFRRIFG